MTPSALLGYGISSVPMIAQVPPNTPGWNPTVGLVMILCNVLAIVIGYFAIQHPGQGPTLPVPQLSSRKSFGIPELLATTSFGHILGTGVILGLSNAGLL